MGMRVVRMGVTMIVVIMRVSMSVVVIVIVAGKRAILSRELG